MNIMHIESTDTVPNTPPLGREERRAVLARLRAGLRPAAASADTTAGWRLGIPLLDEATGTLSVAAVHEAVPETPADAASAAGFVVALALRRIVDAETRPVLWCAQRGGLYEAGALSGRGLADLGADPGRFLLTAARSDADVLWALEEAVRSGAVALAVGEVEATDLTATRRLSLAAREHGVPVLLLRPARGLGASAARTRWRIAAAPSRPPRFGPQVPGRARWRVALEKGWRERLVTWVLEWNDEAHCFLDTAALADRAAADVLPLARTG